MTVIIRIIKAVLISVFIFVVLYFAAVLAGGLITTGETDFEAEVVIYLQNNGRHIDIWLPVEYCPLLAGGRSGWLSFGWGDRDFYLSTPYVEDLAPSLLFRTLLLPTQAVIAVGYSESEPAAGDLTRIEISRGQAAAAWGFINEYLMDGGASGAYRRVPTELVHRSYGNTVFYEAAGRYSLFYTCNNWTGGVLRSAGIRTGGWTPLTFGVYRD